MVSLVLVAASVALTMVLLAGCGGGGDDRARVEDGLRDYLGALSPARRQSSFPTGAGVPRVRRKACNDGHVKVPSGQVLWDRAGVWKATLPEEVALWTCVVTLGGVVGRATEAVSDRHEDLWATDLVHGT